MKLRQINMLLEGGINYRNSVIGAGKGAIADKNGDPRSPGPLIKEIAVEINRLKMEQLRFISLCEESVEGLNPQTRGDSENQQ